MYNNLLINKTWSSWKRREEGTHLLVRNRKKNGNGVVKQKWQEYLGNAEKILEMKKKSEGMSHIRLKSFQYEKTAALLAVSNELNLFSYKSETTCGGTGGGMRDCAC